MLNPPQTNSLDLDTYINSNCPIDWSTFTFIANAGQTLVNPTTLTGLFGTATLDINHNLVYNWVTNSTNTEIIRWRVCNTCVPQECSNTGYNFYVLNGQPAPVAVNDSVCAICQEQVIFYPLLNDTGIYNPATLEITTAPLHGTDVVDNGTIIYTPILYTGNDTIQYTISGYDSGTTSNTATITVQVKCPGNSVAITTCT